MHPLQTTLCPNHYWNTSLQLLLLQKPIRFPFNNHLIKLTCPWWQYAELRRVRWTKIPLSPRKGNIGGCQYNTVVVGCISDSLALVSCAEDAFGFKNDWNYSAEHHPVASRSIFFLMSCWPHRCRIEGSTSGLWGLPWALYMPIGSSWVRFSKKQAKVACKLRN